MGVSKVELSNGETLVDLTEDTVTAETLGEGATAHNSKGEEIVGTMKSGDMLKSVYDTDDDGKVDMANDSEKLEDKSFTEVMNEAYLGAFGMTGQLAPAICDENGLITPNGGMIGEIDGVVQSTTEEYYYCSYLQILGIVKTRGYITLDVTADIHPVDGKLSLKLKAKSPIDEAIEIPIDVSRTSPLVQGNTYTLVLNCDNIESDDGIDFSRITGSIIGGSELSEETLAATGLESSWLANGLLPMGTTMQEEGKDEIWIIPFANKIADISDDEKIIMRELTVGVGCGYPYFIFILVRMLGSWLSVPFVITKDTTVSRIKIPFGTTETGPWFALTCDVGTKLLRPGTYTISFNVAEEALEPNNEDGFVCSMVTLSGLDPETDTVPTEGSTNFITSGAVYDVIGDINSILDNINGEVV